MTASRMRACACDTAARLCVRTVLCSSAFSLAPPLGSTSSATAEVALFPRFFATSGRSDFSLAFIVGYSLRPSRRGPGHGWWGRRWRSPGSQVEGFCACQGLRRRGAGSYLAITIRTISPSVGRKTSASRTCLTPLNTWPTHSPINASLAASRLHAHDLGSVWLATPSPQRTCTVYLPPVSRRTRPQHHKQTHAPQQNDPHSITSSAWASSKSGVLRPRAL